MPDAAGKNADTTAGEGERRMAADMSDTGEDFTKYREKHLEMLQKVIDRLASASITMKRYCMIVTAAAIGVARISSDTTTIYGAMIMVLVFWTMDARYLQHEKWIRHVFNDVRKEPPTVRPDYRISPTLDVRSRTSLIAPLCSWSTAMLYVPLLILLFCFVRSK